MLRNEEKGLLAQGQLDFAQARAPFHSTIIGRLVKMTTWSVIGAILSRALTLGAMIILGRLLGASDFGQLGMLQSTFGLFGLFAGTGLGMTATKYVAEYRLTDPRSSGEYLSLLMWMAIIGGGLSSAILFFISPWLAADVFRTPGMIADMRIGTSLVFFGAVNGVQNGGMAGLEDFRTSTAVNTTRGLIQVIVATGGTYVAGLTGAVVGLALAEACSAVVGQIGLRRACQRIALPVSYTMISKDKLPSIWQFTLPTVLASFVVQPSMWTSNLLLINQPAGFIGLGIYNAADKYRQLLLFLPASLHSAVLSLLSNLHGSNDLGGFRRVFIVTLGASVFVTILPAAILVVFSSHAMGVFGPDFRSGSKTLTVLSASAIFVVLNNGLGQALVSTGRTWLRFWLDVVLACTLVSCSWWLVPIRLDVGLAFASLAAYGVTSLLLIFVVVRILKRVRAITVSSANVTGVGH